MTGNGPFSFPHTPADIRLRRAEKVLEITFDDGSYFSFPAEFLRVHSPSAEVQGHSPEERQVVAGRRHVGILGLELVGQYAIRIDFDDFHFRINYKSEKRFKYQVTFFKKNRKI